MGVRGNEFELGRPSLRLLPLRAVALKSLLCLACLPLGLVLALANQHHNQHNCDQENEDADDDDGNDTPTTYIQSA